MAVTAPSNNLNSAITNCEHTHSTAHTHTHTIHNLFGFIHERLVRVGEKKIKSQSKMKKKKIEQNRESCTIRRASDVHGNKHKA